MKGLFLSFLLLTSTQSILANNQALCTDKRAALIGPCADADKSRFFIQGSCSKSYEFETTYCATEEMTNFETIEEEVELPFEPHNGYETALFHGNGMMTIVEEGVVENCQNAIVLTGQPKESIENYDPTKGEIGIGHVVLKFSCLD